MKVRGQLLVKPHTAVATIWTESHRRTAASVASFAWRSLEGRGSRMWWQVVASKVNSGDFLG